MDATRLYLADCVGVIVLPISRIIIASVYKELIRTLETKAFLLSDKVELSSQTLEIRVYIRGI